MILQEERTGFQHLCMFSNVKGSMEYDAAG